MDWQDVGAIVGVLVVLVTFVAWLVKVEADSRSRSEANAVALETYKVQCERERAEIKSGRSDGEEKLWEAVNELKNIVSNGFQNMSQSIGRLEGRMEGKNDR